MVDSREARARGWRRICQFGLFFYPSSIDVTPVSRWLSEATRRPISARGLEEGAVPGGLYPWRWARDDRRSFDRLSGPLTVAPILQALILNRFPEKTLDWVRRVRRWPFKRIIPCHLANDLKATPAEFVRAFDFLETSPQAAAAAGRAAATPTATPARAGLFGRLVGAEKGPTFSTGTNPDFALLERASRVCTAIGITDVPRAGPLCEE